MTEPTSRFDSAAFFRALEATVLARGLRWKDVSSQTNVGQSTLSRMSQGKGPDSGSLAVLAAWAALNPADFVAMDDRAAEAEPLARVGVLLRRDPRLSSDAAEMIESLVRSAYERLAQPKQ